MAPVSPPPSLADAASAYLRRRRSLLVRLARVERALRRWDVREADGLLPEDLQRPVTPPVLTREALDGLHRMLAEELARLDGGGPES
jgi:hypothetical protein